MDKYPNHRAIIFSIILLLIVSCFTPISITQKQNQNNIQCLNTDDGQILYGPMQSTTTYLIDKDGVVNHTWESDYTPGEAVYMLNDGSILRTIKLSLAYLGAGGGVQKISWNGTLLWDFRYDDSKNLSHHDIKVLPNGNILMIAWEFKTLAEAIAAGRNPNLLPDRTFMSEHIIEVKPTGQTTGDIVWEWRAWDHLIQDYDSSKDNYGIVGNHPELIDINFGDYFAGYTDWLHCNSIDYNANFDQILLSVLNFDEIWVIDHSTTTEEAAGHTGGNSGKGGDLLYRWGNPQSYRRGDDADKKLFGQHDASWIKSGCPGAGDILIFNNGVGRPEGSYSSVDEIIPPVDNYGNYYLQPGLPYGPENETWTYTANNPLDWFASSFSSAERIYNGDTLICDGPAGKLFQVTPEKEIVWLYVNPYPNFLQNNVFKIQYIQPNETPPFANFIFSPDFPKQNEIIQFNDTSFDFGGTIISWFWDFGDGNTSTDKNPTNKYSEIGTYKVTLKVTDNDNLTGTISKNITILNDKTPTPPSINGPTKGKPGIKYDYNFLLAEDPNEDNYYLYIDWGDGANTGWLGPYSSGELVTTNYSWAEKGTFTIKAKVKNIYAESEWGYLEINMPINRISFNTLLQRFIQNYKNMFPIIRYLIRIF